MDVWHRIGIIFRFSNLGTFIFFLLNITFLCIIFFPYGITQDNFIILLICYIFTVLISFSSIGEWMLATLIGAKEIKRYDLKLYLNHLLDEVLEQVNQKTPNMINSINLKIINDSSPNAFAIGRKTICVTDGLLKLTEVEIMAILAHEFGHLVYKHSLIQLLIGGGNIFISGCLLLIKFVCWIITGIFTLFAIESKNYKIGILMVLIGWISTGLIFLWMKFCMIFLRWSMRQNEYVADKYAFELGYGSVLANLLDRYMCSPPENGFLKALYATHPHSYDRIAHLQELGLEYRRY